MSGIALGPFRFVTDREAGGLRDLDGRLPTPNSLRRAGDEAKMGVAAAAEALRAADLRISERVGVYVGQQQGSLDSCERFVRATYQEGPRLASPMLFSESVANNTATHLSLTFGVRGSVQTFIGSRVAGIQAVAAAREDLESGVTDAGLVVVSGVSTRLTRDAYESVFFPFRRDRRPDLLTSLQGAVAFTVRRGEGPSRLLYAGVRCFGRGAKAARAVRSLRDDCPAPLSRVVASTFLLSGRPALAALREGLGGDVAVEPGPSGVGECFALDPFLRLAEGRDPGPRAVVCLSEEGTAGLLAVEELRNF